MTETWLPVEGYEGYYEVSDLGRVRSVDRIVRAGSGSHRLRGQLMTCRTNQGYAYVRLTRESIGRDFRVHRLVARAFVAGYRPDLEALHGEGGSLDNRASNLSWGTRSQNELDKVHAGTHQQTRKTHCPQGHAYDEANTYRAPGRPRVRECLTCRRALGRSKNQAYRARKRQEAAA